MDLHSSAVCGGTFVAGLSLHFLFDLVAAPLAALGMWKLGHRAGCKHHAPKEVRNT